MNHSRPVTIPSPPVSKLVSGNEEKCDKPAQNNDADPINEPLPSTNESGCRRSFLILKPQSVNSTFTRMHESGIMDSHQNAREVSCALIDSKAADVAISQHKVEKSSAAVSDASNTNNEEQNAFVGIAADVTDSSGRHVLMTPQQLESRLGTEPAFRRAGTGAAVPPLSFATLATFAPTPGSGAEASPGGDIDSSSASERDLLRDLRQVIVASCDNENFHPLPLPPPPLLSPSSL